ncbi:MAG: hypothetical protein ACRC3H_16780 [Lachnospiraceae bacterium]
MNYAEAFNIITEMISKKQHLAEREKEALKVALKALSALEVMAIVEANK